MAVYFLRARHVSRGKGARVTRAAAYRAGECITDQRTGEVHNYSDRRDVVYKEVVLPEELAARADMAWTQDRSTLWNAAEYAGRRRNSRLAREWLVLLPPELNPPQRSGLVRTFAKELADKYRCAVDVSIHEPRPGADPRNHHAHLLMTVREVKPDGFGPRISLELGGSERRQAGLGPTLQEYLGIRERWAQVTNEALQQAGVTARVDHRSLARQGINREPVPTLPEKVFYAERRTRGHTDAGDAIRARHRERMEARRQSATELSQVVEKQRSQLRARAREDFKRQEMSPKQIRWNALTREERNAHRRERYAARRAREREDPVQEAQRREAAHQRYRARMRRNGETIRAERRRRREAHADEENRKQREYRRERAARRLSQSPAPTAEQSAKNWRTYRENHPSGPTAEVSARAWRDFREREDSLGHAPAARSRAAERALANTSDRGEADPKSSPNRDHDFGL
jgi:MobA/MobL family protein